MDDGISPIGQKLKNLKVCEDTREINILLLGETGVGKSTFINAFINYVTFSTLSNALDENFESVIPSKFTITDENYEERIVQIGKDHNESVEVGASATQACRSYLYPLQGTGLKLRLIDTPGVGDTRGIDQDNINFENVLSFIAEFKHLNAICILLKPNNSRLTVMFEFCIKQLLSRMIAYVVGDKEYPGLIPHEVKNTISVNEARRLIVQLSQPLAEIVQVIQDNIRALDTHQKELQLTDTTLSRLKTNLYIPIVDLKVMELDQPTTVCTSLKCSTVYQVGDKKKWHYHQKCHAPCYLINVPKEIIGSPELIKCAAMDSQGECRQCTCRYQVHMHIYYTTETFESKLEDESVKTTIASKKQALQRVQNLTRKIHTRIATLEMERETVLKTTAKFACFLKTNAIAPYNDAYEAYLKYLIDREKSLNDATDFELIKQMERMLCQYNEEKKTIMNAISLTEDGVSTIKADDIIYAIKTLYSLKIFGAKIKELFAAQNRSRKDENKSETKEFVYSTKSGIKKGVSGRGKKQQKINSSNRLSNFKPEQNFSREKTYPNQNIPEVNVTVYPPYLHQSYSSDPRQVYPQPLYQNMYAASSSGWVHPPSNYRWVSPNSSYYSPPPLMDLNCTPPNNYAVRPQPPQSFKSKGTVPRNTLPKHNSNDQVKNRGSCKGRNNRHNLDSSDSD
ncbi:hypothetical protein FQR65_LT06232 [Abscondita terminalis]|nr:hypothetical protein FQR65_LT06232 [Abscondita terminalis]